VCKGGIFTKRLLFLGTFIYFVDWVTGQSKWLIATKINKNKKGTWETPHKNKQSL
jgi:hypothetical protein